MREFHGPVGGSSAASSDYAFTTGDHPEVVVDIGYADLTIYQRKEPGVTVNVTHDGWRGFGSKAPEITAKQDGESVRVVAAETSAWSWGDDRMVTIAVAPGTRVMVQNAGDIRATGLRGEASFNSVGLGSILIDDFNGPSLTVETSNGRLTMHNIVTAQLDANSSNGRVEGTALQVRDGHVDSSNGRVTLGFAAGADTTVTAAASNGHVDVSGLGVVGTPKVKSADDEDDDDDDDSSSKTVRIGAGSGRLDVHASNGSINLSQEG
jgi:hypothetical protein